MSYKEEWMARKTVKVLKADYDEANKSYLRQAIEWAFCKKAEWL